MVHAPSATSASVKNLRPILQSCLASLLSKTGSGLSADPPDRNNDPFKASVCRSKGPGSRVRLLSRTGGGSRTATLRETAARSSASPSRAGAVCQHAACTARRHPTHLAPGVLQQGLGCVHGRQPLLLPPTGDVPRVFDAAALRRSCTYVADSVVVCSEDPSNCLLARV
jgi:hypothetical protein